MASCANPSQQRVVQSPTELMKRVVKFLALCFPDECKTRKALSLQHTWAWVDLCSVLMGVSPWERQKCCLKSELCWSKTPFLTADTGLMAVGSTYRLELLWSQWQGAREEVNASGWKQNWSIETRKPESESPNSSSSSSYSCLLTFSLWSLDKRLIKVFQQSVEASALSRGILSSLNIVHFFCLSSDRLAWIIFCHPG